MAREGGERSIGRWLGDRSIGRGLGDRSTAREKGHGSTARQKGRGSTGHESMAREASDQPLRAGTVDRADGDGGGRAGWP